MNYSSLVGVPYKNMDCWEIVRQFYAIEFGIELPVLYLEVPENRDMVEKIVYDVKKDFCEVAGPRKFGDILLLKLFGVECHVGVYLGNGQILHTTDHSGCVVDRFSRWEKLTVATYRVRDSK